MAVKLYKFDNETEWLDMKRKAVTATEVASLFGFGYKSRRRLWHEKRGDIEPDFVDNNAMRWGRRLQNVVGQGIAKDNGWRFQSLDLHFYLDDSLWLGASPDGFMWDTPAGTLACEIKTTERFSDDLGWTDESAPIPYEFQNQHQMHLILKYAPGSIGGGVIAALGTRQNVREYHRAYDDRLGALIDQEAESFWHSIKQGTPPDPDWRCDSDLIAQFEKPVRAGEAVNLSLHNHAMALMQDYVALEQQVQPIKEEIDKIIAKKIAIKNEILHIMGEAETAIIGDYKIKARMQRNEERFTPSHEFRRFDLSKATGKAKKS